jgi:hypothetical protein
MTERDTMSTARKILVSPGYGAGWSSWASGDSAKTMLTYQPIIDFLENGGDSSDLHALVDFGRPPASDSIVVGESHYREIHPLLVQFLLDLHAHLGGVKVPYFFLGGACQLEVRTVYGQVRVEDYDGNESVTERDSDDGWM